VVWSPREARSWPSFSARLPYALRSLDRLHVGYRMPDVEGLAGNRLTLNKSVTVSLSTALPEGIIRYTIDGTTPTATSAIYSVPIVVPVDARGVRISAKTFASDGRASATRTATYAQTTLAAPVAVDAPLPGLSYEYYERATRTVSALDTAPVIRSGVVTSVARRGDERAENYGLRLTGYVRAPSDGMYEFALMSDDGSTLSVAGKLVADNDGYHGAEEKTGMIALSRGLHPFAIRYVQATGGATLSLRVRREGGAWQLVPADWLFHARR
jgi:hexosaminidase